MFKAAAVQADVEFKDKAENLSRLRTLASEAATEGADLVVFPECFLTGYVYESREEALAQAEPVPGPSSEEVARIAEELGVWIVCGLIERAETGGRTALYNSLIVVRPGALHGLYRKTHLPHLGVDHFVDPGDLGLPVFETPFGRVGTLICYDGAFPEAARVLALRGADLIVLPTNWPLGAEEFALYGINTRALENTAYFLAADRVGEERGFRFIGRSRIADPYGRTLAEADTTSETILVAGIDPERARRKRIDRVPGRHWIDRIADRRPELYGDLVKPRKPPPAG